MPQFQQDKYVKVVDVEGNFHYGFISFVRERGFALTISLEEEGLSKINYDDEFARRVAGYTSDFEGTLSAIEKKIVGLLAEFKTTKEIGQLMGISPITVQSHLGTLKLKLRVNTREQLLAYSQGIVRKLNGPSPNSNTPE